MSKNGDDESLDLRGKRVVLLLQGGGALGAYQVGAYEALQQACEAVNNKVAWVGGISNGAINAAVIAGPKCGNAAMELKKLWNELATPSLLPFDPPSAGYSWLTALAPKYWNFASLTLPASMLRALIFILRLPISYSISSASGFRPGAGDGETESPAGHPRLAQAPPETYGLLPSYRSAYR